VPTGGWAFEFENDTYPDIDDSAVVVLALLEGGYELEVRPAVDRAVQWLRAMRSKNGAWGAFDKDNTRQIVYRLPFADFGALLDPPSEDVTAHVLEMLARVEHPEGHPSDTQRHPEGTRQACGGVPGSRGTRREDPVVAQGLAYLRQTQKADGSWFGRWGVNHVYGTWCVISALAALRDAGWDIEDMIHSGAAWLLSRQNRDGGWGESCYSYVDSSFAGIGCSTPSQTAWAVISLELAGLSQHPACVRGLTWLRERQLNGTWEEQDYTGTGFPRDFYLNYHLYRHLFPTMALALSPEL
jgi:squalene-hopene/tetraprenyl-beta-curcumene cyclase